MKTLIDVLITPRLLISLSAQNQSLIISEARYFTMLAQLYYLYESEGLLDKLPQKIRTHLHNSTYQYQCQHAKLLDEKGYFVDLFTAHNFRWIYLKGSAYQLSNMPYFKGRMMGDIDILVEEDALASVEHCLLQQGWMAKKVTDYDDSFYRKLAHEIPPLTHLIRKVDLDVHFNILPRTIKQRIDPQLLFAASIPLEGNNNERTLLPAAMLFHSAIHLFSESEFHKGLRDLYDIRLFIQAHQQDDAFWQQLIELHQKLGHQQSLFLALRYARIIFNATIPRKISRYYHAYRPSRAHLALLDYCFIPVFTHSFAPRQTFKVKCASAFLYLRGHLKRMPLPMLIMHLSRKSWLNLQPNESNTKAWR